jgi:hypothetical protein
MRAGPEHAVNPANGIYLKNEHREGSFWKIRDNGTLSFRPGPRGLVLQCQSGTLLVTQEGDPLDHVLGACDEFRTDGRGLVVVWALSDGAVSMFGRPLPVRRGT